MSRLGVALVVGLSTVLSLAVAEALVRWVMPQPVVLFDPGLYQLDDALGYRHRPGYRGVMTNIVEYRTRIEIDALGLRGFSPGYRGNSTRVLVIGDSFVFGQGVEANQTIASRLEDSLVKLGRRSEVLNAGVRGYGVDQEAGWLQELGPVVKPQIVVLGVFLGNDLEDDVTSPRLRFSIVAPPQLWHTFVTGTLNARSHLYRALRNSYRRLSGAETASRRSWLQMNYSAALGQYPATERALDRMVRTAGELHASLFAFLIPDRMQVERSGQDAFAQEMRANPTLHLDLDHPNRVFAAMLSARGIPFLDLTPALRERAQQGPPLYFATDRHWNAAGHEAAAEMVATRITTLIH